MKPWLKGLVAAAIGGGAQAGVALSIAPDKFNFSELTNLGTVFVIGALVTVLGYLKQSPLPPGQ